MSGNTPDFKAYEVRRAAFLRVAVVGEDAMQTAEEARHAT